ncbi:helix-turn-helix domain-containing protein [Microlunatus elymi]|uniref:Helix-turn-helix domain-containing protein n=1 Tax=Microlunatus elymi TaxID=2596828 RepID=A0A516Q380_9ACTN|nr:helix-turn-helix domain-containing protein [Microlunatus elymi]QDP97879.1 helix-turn-helix domain-containing protein [Microlunatus elymi]
MSSRAGATDRTAAGLKSVAPLKRVSVILTEPVSVFEFAMATEIFGIDRRDEGYEPFDFRVCALHPERPLVTKTVTPFQIIASHGLDAVKGSQLVIVSATPPRGEHGYPPQIIRAIQQAHDDGAVILSLCSGAFLLGAAGLLDGRPSTTHWMYADELQQEFPRTRVDCGVLYVDDGNVITSAGTAAGIDAALHLIRRELGQEIAIRIARRMVVPPHRDGGQQQFVDLPLPVDDSEALGGLLAWISDNLAEPHSAASLARRLNLSERTFARRFVAETGATPHKWINQQRVLEARRLLEESDLSVEQIADRVGFNSSVVLRDHFRRHVGLAPVEYRRRFGQVHTA